MPDYATLDKAADAKRIDYPKPDNVLSFDKLSSVFLSNTNHEEDQPCHLRAHGPDDSDRAQPAGVRRAGAALLSRPRFTKWSTRTAAPRFQINAQNCVHCKTCDIKDPAQNITWVVPEGTGGPNYPNM